MTSRAVRAAISMVGALVLILSTLSAPGAVAQGDQPGGPVVGTVVADMVNGAELGLCTSACIDGSYVSDDVEGNHLLRVVERTGGPFRSVEDAVPAGTYRIAFAGAAYDGDGGAWGYLRRTRSGRYQVMKDISRGTAFTVAEGRALDVGTLDLRSGLVTSAGNMTAYGYGGEFSSLEHKYRARDVPRGATTRVITTGCGGRTYVKSYDRTGSFVLTWHDARASRRYGKSLRLRIVMTRAGDPPKTFYFGRYDIDSFGWRCT